MKLSPLIRFAIKKCQRASEFFDEAKRCLEHLGSLGYKQFSFSVGEELNFRIEWTDSRPPHLGNKGS
jgi:hypothetical protein